MPSRASRFRKIGEDVRGETNDALSKEISKLLPLTPADITRLMPTKADKQNLADLMAIVTSRTKENEKVAKLVQNIGDYGSIIVRLLKTATLR